MSGSMNSVPVLLFLSLAVFGCSAPEPDGSIDASSLTAPARRTLSALRGAWTGEIGKSRQRVVFRFVETTDGERAAFLDLPDNGHAEAPLTGFVVDGDALEIAFATLGIQFDGRLATAGTRLLEGVLSDGRRSFPISMTWSDGWAPTHLVPRRTPDGGREIRYAYRPPASGRWPVARLDRPSIATFESIVEEVLDERLSGVDAILVARNGTLLAEEYFHGFDATRRHSLRSVTKSVAAILAGAAVESGALDGVDRTVASIDPVLADVHGWGAVRRNITVDHLLTMSSGLDGDDWKSGGSHEEPVQATDDWVGYVAALPSIAPPGERFAYNGASLLLLARALERTSGTTVPTFATRHVFGPLGIEDALWHTSPAGTAYLSAGLSLRPRDVLRLGLLWLRDGVVDGRRLLPEGFVEFASRARWTVPFMNARYGRLWWSDTVTDDAGDEVEVTMALGLGGQGLFIVPARDLVIAVLAGNYYLSDRARQSREIMRRLLRMRASDG